jgi:hypothetical protein
MLQRVKNFWSEGQAPIDENNLSGEVTGLLGGHPRNSRSDVFYLSKAFNGDSGHNFLLQGWA